MGETCCYAYLSKAATSRIGQRMRVHSYTDEKLSVSVGDNMVGKFHIPLLGMLLKSRPYPHGNKDIK